MQPSEMVAGVMLVALVLYSLTGGADFGGGVWDLLARGERREAQRKLIARVLAPVWEANHVWLILVVVLLFVAFPKANAGIATALHIPLTVMLMGIVLRGTAFVFRTYDDQRDEVQQRWSKIFAIASIVAPFFLGISLGAVASGTMTYDPKTGLVITDYVSQWLAPFPIAVGVWVVTLDAFLAAVYLTNETDDPGLLDDFRRRALGAGVAVGAMALVALFAALDGAPTIAAGLTAKWWSIPFHVLTGLVAVAALYALYARRYPLARLLAIAQVSFIVGGWGLSQYPYLIAPDLTITAASAPDSVLVPMLVALGLGTVVLVPSFWYLYRVFRFKQNEESNV